jgi:hypothetical protein
VGALLGAALAPARWISAQARAAAHLGVIDGIVTDTSLAPLGDVTVSFIGSTLRVVTGRTAASAFATCTPVRTS